MSRFCAIEIFEPASHTGAAGFNVVIAFPSSERGPRFTHLARPTLGKLAPTLVGGALGSLTPARLRDSALSSLTECGFTTFDPDMRSVGIMFVHTGHSLLRSTFAHTFDPTACSAGIMFVHPWLHFVCKAAHP